MYIYKNNLFLRNNIYFINFLEYKNLSKIMKPRNLTVIRKKCFFFIILCIKHIITIIIKYTYFIYNHKMNRCINISFRKYLFENIS